MQAEDRPRGLSAGLPGRHPPWGGKERVVETAWAPSSCGGGVLTHVAAGSKGTGERGQEGNLTGTGPQQRGTECTSRGDLKGSGKSHCSVPQGV